MYRAFISGQKSQWAVVFNTDNNGFSDIEELEYLYGYIGWLITDKDKDATHYLFMMRDKIGNAHLTPSQKALYNSISLSYGILLGKNNTIISGPQTLKSVKKALTLDSLSYMNNIQMANVLLNMPAVFGGSKEKAAGYYLRARFILEENNQTQSWIYIYLLYALSDLYKDINQNDESLKYLNLVKSLEPEFFRINN